MFDKLQTQKWLGAFWLCGLCLMLSGCQTGGGYPSTTSSLSPAAHSVSQGASVNKATYAAPAYRLGSGDKVKVSVFGEDELSGEFLVGDDGRLHLPLIGAVQASNLTANEVQSVIVARYSDGYLKEPKVSVSVLNYRPFFITGEVGKGGEYPYKAGLTVQDAVAIAGGYTYRANTAKAYVRKAGQDREVAVQLNQRVAVEPGDIVRIPERFF